VTAREDEGQAVVGDRAHALLLDRELIQACEQLGLARERLLASNPVDRAVPRRRDDPRTGIRRQPVSGPSLERGREGVLNGILGELEVAEDPDENRNGTAPLLAEDQLDRRCRDPSQSARP
jgi:hypothetical protein